MKLQFSFASRPPSWPAFFGSEFLYYEMPKGVPFFEYQALGLYSFAPITVSWDNQVRGHMVLCDSSGTCYQTQASGSQIAITGSFTVDVPGRMPQTTPSTSLPIRPAALH